MRLARLEVLAERRRQAANGVLDGLRADPPSVMTDAGFCPDPWQVGLLRSNAARTLLLCSRQAGKSLTAAALVVRTFCLEPYSLVLILSPTLRQSGEILRDKVLALYDRLGQPVPQ